MFSYFEEIFKNIFIQKNLQNVYANCIREDDINVSKEYRKILDKVAKRLIYNEFDNENLIEAVMNLASVERIIIAFMEMKTEEMTFLLDTIVESTSVQNILQYKSNTKA